MAARLWRNEEACVEAIERSLKGIEVIQNQCRIDMLDPSVADAIGRSLYQHFSNFCEGVLYIICCMKATIDGTRDFPKLKDLLTQGDLVNATPEAKLASNGISGLKKSFDNGPISLDMIRLCYMPLITSWTGRGQSFVILRTIYWILMECLWISNKDIEV